MNIEQFLQDKVRAAVTALYGEPAPGQVQIQKTRKEFDGDMTLVVFPLLKLSRAKIRKPPQRRRQSAGRLDARNQKFQCNQNGFLEPVP